MGMGLMMGVEMGPVEVRESGGSVGMGRYRYDVSEDGNGLAEIVMGR